MMKMVIRDLETGLFLCRRGDWASDGRLAQNDATEAAAMKQVDRHEIKNAEFVMVNAHGRVSGGTPLRISD